MMKWYFEWAEVFCEFTAGALWHSFRFIYARSCCLCYFGKRHLHSIGVIIKSHSVYILKGVRKVHFEALPDIIWKQTDACQKEKSGCYSCQPFSPTAEVFSLWTGQQTKTNIDWGKLGHITQLHSILDWTHNCYHTCKLVPILLVALREQQCCDTTSPGCKCLLLQPSNGQHAPGQCHLTYDSQAVFQLVQWA